MAETTTRTSAAGGAARSAWGLKLRIPASPARLARIVEENRFDRVPSPKRGAGRRIRRAQPGGWRESLTEREQEAMHEVMGTKLAELGYLDREPAPGLRETA